MKKKFVFAAAAAVACSCVLTAGCIPGLVGHNHAFSNKYAHNETHHWYPADCGHDEKSDYAEHEFSEDVCVDCYYEREHVHLFNEEAWDFDLKTHWHPAVCGHEQEKGGVANHNIANGACECGFAYTQALEYVETEGGYAVAGIGTATLRNDTLIIPAEYNGKPVLSIKRRAFTNASIRIDKIILPESLTGFEQYAFNDLSVYEVVLPQSLESIEAGVFSGCYHLETVTFNNPETTIIGTNAFNGCESLEKIIFNGTKEQWNAVKKYYQWDEGTGDYTVYCIDGEIAKSA